MVPPAMTIGTLDGGQRSVKIDGEQPSATLHLSYAFSAATSSLLQTRHIEHCALEASRANFCFHSLLVSIDIPPPKTAQHSRELIESAFGRKLVLAASVSMNIGRDALRRTCAALGKSPTAAELLIIDYANSSIVTSLHQALHAFVAFGEERDQTPSLRSLRLDQHFRSNPAVFLVHAHVKTELLFHQDGDRGFEFTKRSPFFHEALRAMRRHPRIYVGLADGCRTPTGRCLDCDREAFARCCPAPGWLLYNGSGGPVGDKESRQGEKSWHGFPPQLLYQHQAVHRGSTYPQHVSQCGALWHLPRWRSLWPAPKDWWMRDVDYMLDSNVARHYDHPDAPAHTVYLPSTAGGCAVGDRLSGGEPEPWMFRVDDDGITAELLGGRSRVSDANLASANLTRLQVRQRDGAHPHH